MIDADEAKIIKLSKELPSSNSKDYGKPFKKIFLDYEKDFYKIDGTLFSPASITLNSKQTGKIYSTGKTDSKLIESSFSSIWIHVPNCDYKWYSWLAQPTNRKKSQEKKM